MFFSWFISRKYLSGHLYFIGSWLHRPLIHLQFWATDKNKTFCCHCMLSQTYKVCSAAKLGGRPYRFTNEQLNELKISHKKSRE